MITTLLGATAQEELSLPGLKDFSPSFPSWLLWVTREGISWELPMALSTTAHQSQTLLMGVASVFLMILGMNPLGSGQEESPSAGQVTILTVTLPIPQKTRMCFSHTKVLCWEHEGRWDEGCPVQQDTVESSQL